MSVSLFVSLVSVVVSLVALALSSVLSFRQLELSQQSKHLAAFAELMADFRRPEFHDRFSYVVTELQAEYDPATGVGIFDLPNEPRAITIDILYFFQNAAAFAGFGLIDENSLVVFLRTRLIAVWRALGPYIENERANNPAVGRAFCSSLEHYARAAESGEFDAVPKLVARG